MKQYKLVGQVTLVVEAESAQDALVLGEQSVLNAMWVERHQWIRLQEVDYVDYVDAETVDSGAPYGGRLDRRVRG